MNSDLAQKSKVGMLWMTFLVGGQGLLLLLINAIWARFLSPTLIGEFITIQAFILIVAYIFQGGLNFSLVQQKNLQEKDWSTAFIILTSIGIFCCLLLNLLANPLSRFLNFQNSLAEFYFMSLSIIFICAGTAPEAKIRKELQFSLLSKINLSCFIFSYFMVGIPLLYLDKGRVALMASYLAYYILCSLMYFYFSKFRLRAVLTRENFKNVTSQSRYYTLANIVCSLATEGDKILFAHFFGGHVIGLYSRANQIMLVPASFFEKIPNQVLFSSLSKISQDKELLRKIYIKGLYLTIYLTIPIAAFTYFFSQEIVEIILGIDPKWSQASGMLKILAFAMVFRVSYKVGDTFARSCAIIDKLFWAKFIYFTTMIAFIALGSLWGVDYAIWGVVGSIILHFIFMNKVIVNHLELSARFLLKRLLYYIPQVILSVLVAFASYFFAGILATHVLGKIVIGFFIFAVLLLIAQLNNYLLPHELKWFKEYMLGLIFFNKQKEKVE